MLEQIEYFFDKIGYMSLDTNRSDVRIFFQLERNFVNAIHVIDCDQMPQVSKEDLNKFMKPVQWQFGEGQICEVHMISLVLTENPDALRDYVSDNGFCWFIHTQNKELLVYDDKVTDYYGLREKLEQCLKEPFDEEAYRQKKLQEDEQEEPPQKLSFFHNFWSGSVVNHVIIAVNIIVFIVGIFFGGLFYEFGARDMKAILEQGEWYRPLTSMFLHADVYHLFSNMILLFFLGDIVERMSGHIKYIIFYLGAGICGDLLSMYIDMVNQTWGSSIGASGAVFGIEGALLWILIRNHGRAEYITIPRFLFAVVCSLICGFTSTGIDNAAHVGGFLGGFLLAVLLYRKNKGLKGQEGTIHED